MKRKEKNEGEGNCMNILSVEKESQTWMNILWVRKKRKNWKNFSVVKEKNCTCSGYLRSRGGIRVDSSPSTNLADRQFLPENHGNVRQRLGDLLKSETQTLRRSPNFSWCHFCICHSAIEDRIEREKLI